MPPIWEERQTDIGARPKQFPHGSEWSIPGRRPAVSVRGKLRSKAREMYRAINGFYPSKHLFVNKAAADGDRLTPMDIAERPSKIGGCASCLRNSNDLSSGVCRTCAYRLSNFGNAFPEIPSGQLQKVRRVVMSQTWKQLLSKANTMTKDNYKTALELASILKQVLDDPEFQADCEQNATTMHSR
jgi:hypothetical protein